MRVNKILMRFAHSFRIRSINTDRSGLVGKAWIFIFHPFGQQLHLVLQVRPEFSDVAFREGLVNAFCHKGNTILV